MTAHTTITTTCEACGVVRLTAKDILLSPDRYQFSHCGIVNDKPLNDRIEEVLRAVGVREDHTSSVTTVARASPGGSAGVAAMSQRCVWCGKHRRTFSDWEQEHHRNGWLPLCRPCARKRLDNPYNALLPLRKVAS